MEYIFSSPNRVRTELLAFNCVAHVVCLRMIERLPSFITFINNETDYRQKSRMVPRLISVPIQLLVYLVLLKPDPPFSLHKFQDIRQHKGFHLGYVRVASIAHCRR